MRTAESQDAHAGRLHCLSISGSASVYHPNRGSVLVRMPLSGESVREPLDLTRSYLLVPVAQSDCGGFRSIGLLRLVGLMLCGWPSRAEALLMDANAYNDLGIVRLNKGDLEGAIEQYRVLLSKRANYASAHYALGEALAQKGSRDEAIQGFRKYLALEQDTPVTHQRLEQARARLKELEG